ncbi:MAG: hypothetical protein LBV51_00205 [Acholeplasmatales bacterium]|jgi:hypothetical protein|nr:hypothetical protein [Acholeplasmatales bacterium]
MENTKKEYPWYKLWEKQINSQEYLSLFNYPGNIGRDIQLLWIFLLNLTKNGNGILASQMGGITLVYDAEYISRFTMPGTDIKTIQLGLDYYLKINWLFKNKQGFLEIADKDFVGDQTTESYQRKLRRKKENTELADYSKENNQRLALNPRANQGLIDVNPRANNLAKKQYYIKCSKGCKKL